MTSACGVVEDATVDESKDLKAAFVYGSLKGNGDIFEEFYYNLESMTIAKGTVRFRRPIPLEMKSR